MRVRVYVCVCARERARTNVCACTSQAGPREGCCSLPYFFFTTHSLFLSSSPPLLSLAGPPPHSIQRRCRASSAIPGRGVSRGQVRCEPAPNEAQRAPPVIFLKDLSTGGRSGKRAGYGGAEGSLRREGIPRTREAGRPRCRRSKTPRACFARILLRSDVVLFSRNLPTRESSLQGRFHLR